MAAVLIAPVLVGFIFGVLFCGVFLYTLLQKLPLYRFQQFCRLALLITHGLPGYSAIGAAAGFSLGRSLASDPNSPVRPKYDIEFFWPCPACQRDTFYSCVDGERYPDDLLTCDECLGVGTSRYVERVCCGAANLTELEQPKYP